VAQLNLYVPDDLADDLKRAARKAGLPLSRYIRSLLESGTQQKWPAGFLEHACGFLREPFPEPEDHLPEPVDLGRRRK
jgi:hypothetical protein